MVIKELTAHACFSGREGTIKTTSSSYHMAQQDGVLVLDKPGGITSAACIGKIKRFFGQKKIGHAGTLDPMATGILLILLGQATKISSYLMGDHEKIYSGHIRLGLTTDTWDIEGKIISQAATDYISEAAVLEAMASLVGSYEQEVPAYSAAKHQGRSLYELARKGLPTPVKKKMVRVFWSEAELVSPALVHFRVKCGSGTYIRSLAHSLGNRLGCGATLETLTREYSAPFGLDVACTLDDLQDKPESFLSKVVGIAQALPDWPRVTLDDKHCAFVRNGMSVSYQAEVSDLPLGGQVLLETESTQPLALAELQVREGRKEWSIVRGLWNN